MLSRAAASCRGVGSFATLPLRHLSVASFAGEDSLKTAMHGIHIEAGGKMVPFEGYELPIHYKGQGIVKETQWCRKSASLFDVSHMGQVRLTGDGAAALLERITPTDVTNMQEGEGRYSMLLNAEGGIVDDCIITRMPGYLNVVLNAGCKEKDLEFMHRQLNAAKLDGTVGDCHIDHRVDQQLVALQGPQAAAVLQELTPVEDLATMPFMQARDIMVDTGSGLHKVFAVRCGYTGGDGFELSFPADAVQDLVRRLGAHPSVQLAGLGARDALRLEAGLPLYGADITEATTPIEAGLVFAVSKSRRDTGGFLGADIILEQLTNKAWKRKRIGLSLEGRAPAREGDVLCDGDGVEVGVVTSGSFSPTCVARAGCVDHVPHPRSRTFTACPPPLPWDTYSRGTRRVGHRSKSNCEAGGPQLPS